MKIGARLALLLLSLLALPAHAEDVRRFYGYAYDLKTSKYLYTEVYEQHYEGENWKRGRIRFYAPDGKQLGDKTLDFSAHPYIPVYRFELPAEHYVEAITQVTDSEIRLHKEADGKSQDKTVAAGKDVAADSGFHTYLVAHFDELLQRKNVSFSLAVAGNLDRYKFQAKRVEDGSFEGRKTMRLRVEPDSFLRYLVSPLELSYDPESKKLLEYRGISNVHDPVSGKAYNARIVYASKPPADAPKNLPPLE